MPHTLPIEPEVVTIATLAGREPQDLALFGGEDYELLFTIPEDRADKLSQELLRAKSVKAARIGKIREGSSRTLFRQGTAIPLKSTGWDHLRLSFHPK